MTNHRVGCENIFKRLDSMLISTDFLDYDLHFQQWVGCDGDSDHQPVFFQLLNKDVRPHRPFKFNANSLMNEYFGSLLKSYWNVYVNNPKVSLASYFATNFKKIKDVSISWSVKKKTQENKDLVEIESVLVVSFNKMGFGFSSKDDKSSLV